jgi:hypothetical protein
MQYLVVCNHRKELIEAQSSHDARLIFHCEKCSDQRAYVATSDDTKALSMVGHTPPRPKAGARKRQTSWIG